MDKPLVEKEEDKTTSKRNRIAKSARKATKHTKKEVVKDVGQSDR